MAVSLILLHNKLKALVEKKAANATKVGPVPPTNPEKKSEKYHRQHKRHGWELGEIDKSQRVKF